MTIASAEEVIAFWRDAGQDRWFKPDAGFDAQIRERFLGTHEAAAAGRLDERQQTADGTLALLILLDQFPRNMFRGDARSFATDARALALAKRAIDKGMDAKLPPQQRAFIYLPFQHSEDAADQARSVALFTALGNPLNLDFALRHQTVVDRFGRFPHRNGTLGRDSTDDERAYLKTAATPF